MRRRRNPRAAGILAAASLLAGSTAAGDAAGPPARPAGCRDVRPGPALAELLADASAGDAFCLAPGDYDGSFRIGRPVALWGTRAARIHSHGTGTTVAIEADGTALLGVTIDGSGGRFDQLDAAVRVRADDVRVEGIAVEGALFGLLVEQSHRVLLRGNTVSGPAEKALGMRGDGIRLWEVRDSAVVGNRVHDGRDMVVWYSPGNRFEGNRVERGRYGIHFMYSHENVVEDNRFDRNVVGIFAMYSRNLTIRHNLLARSAGAAGVGLGAKESGGLRVAYNSFLSNTVAVYLDTSPLEPEDTNLFERNVFRLGDAGVVFHGTVDRNHFASNDFGANGSQVRVEGRNDARAAEWTRNHFDDYRGYDLDGDGFGDIPYELRSLSGELVGRHPSLAFFRGSIAMDLVELVGRVVPLFRPRTLLVDPEPRMAALEVAGAD